MTDFFRPEALDAQRDLKWGRPIAVLPPSWRVLTGFFTVLAVAVIIFLSTATFARKESVPGILRLSKGELRVVPARAGVVRDLYVAEGHAVAAGAPLALISTEQQLSEGGGSYDARVLQAIDREQDMLEKRLAALDQSAPLEEKSLVERLNGYQKTLVEMQRQIPRREERAAIAKQASDIGQDLFAKGVMTGDQARQRRTDYLTQDQSVNDLKVQIAQLEGQIAETKASLAKLPSDTAQSRAGILQEIVTLEEKRANTRAQNGFVLTAGSGGIVATMQAALGQPADPAKPLMTIVPPDSLLQAELYVPSRAIGFIQPGTKVRLLYDAFPYQRFGPGAGTIAEIAPTVLRPEEVAAAVPVKEAVYRVIVQLDKTSMHAYGGEVPLLSGMAVTADLILEERSFLALLLDPILAARGRILGD